MTKPTIERLIESLLASDPSVPPDIERHGVNPNEVGIHGRTPLMVMAGEGRIEAFEILVSMGASVNSTGNRSLTALHEAAANGHPRIASRLLDLGASVDAETIDGVTPLMCSAAWGHVDVARILLANAADCSKTDTTGATAADIAREKGEDLFAEFIESQEKRGKTG